MKMEKNKKKNKITFKLSPSEIRNIYKDYTFDTSDILNYDDTTKHLLDAYDNNLTQPEKVILQLYAEFQSQRKVASLLNVSRTTIVKELNIIRKKILYGNNS
jgi:transcriptional regulator of aromatic amino acid metabolism